MYYSTIKNCDIANGPGCRVSLFVSGCRNHCRNCFQPETWDFCYGNLFDSSVEDRILGMLEPSYIAGLTILGGEPFEPENQRGLLPFVKRVRKAFPNKDIWAFSGYTFDRMKTEGEHVRCEVTDELLGCIDVLVDGPFVEELKNISLRFRGSENQRLIDMKATLAAGSVVLYSGR